MTTYPEFLSVVVIGFGATAVMDVWALFLLRAFGIPSLNYAMVGRWIGHIPQGQLVHLNIAKTSPVSGEQFIGWTAHYVIGLVFAGLLLMVWGTEWAQNPTLIPALIMGIATLAAPFFILQPGMGAGIAASKTPKPNVAWLRSLAAHTSFGVGLYLSALLFSLL